jgi:hypothetical protein
MVVGLDGIEPSTSRLSGVRSNRTELQAPGDFGSEIEDLETIVINYFQNPHEPITCINVRDRFLISQN